MNADDDAPNDEGGTTDQQDNDVDSGDQRSQRQDTTRRDAPPADSPEQDNKDSGKTFTQADVDKLIADRIARERKKFGDYGDLQKKAARLAKIEDEQKSETEKLTDQLTAAQVELQGFRVNEARRAAAESVGLPAKWAKRITAADPDEALAEAKELKRDLDAMTPESKTADMRQGARSTARQPESRDDLIRRMTGHG